MEQKRGKVVSIVAIGLVEVLSFSFGLTEAFLCLHVLAPLG